MVETEPEFNVDERESWQALAEWRNSLCPHCGNLRSVCSNPEGLSGEGVYPQLDYCWVKAAETRSRRMFEQLHEKAKPDEAGYLPTDGAVVWASLTNDSPDHDFLMESIDLPPELLVDFNNDEDAQE